MLKFLSSSLKANYRAAYHCSVGFLPMQALSQSSGKALVGLSVPLIYSQSFKTTALCTASETASEIPLSEETKKQTTPKIFQYKICPFCNRVKSYLDFLQIEYDTVEVNPLNKSEIDFPVTTKKVPIAIFDGKVVEDSKNIIALISGTIVNESPRNFNKKDFFPADTEKWTEWSEKELAILLYPNITRSYAESRECFSYASDVKNWSWIQKVFIQYAGAAGMVVANGKIKKKYNIVDERKELQERIDVWLDAIKGKKFLHGDHVTLPDLQVFGVLKSVEGLSTFNEVMAQNKGLKIWYNNVNDTCPSMEKENSRIESKL